MSALTGPELLAAVKRLEAEGVGKNDMARQTGYVKTKSDGTESILRTKFYEALLSAKGTTIGESKSSPGRNLTFRTKVQFNGNLMIGGAYTKNAGFKPGDNFEIIVGRKGFTLKSLSPNQQQEACPDGACPVTDAPEEGEEDQDFDSETEGSEPIDG